MSPKIFCLVILAVIALNFCQQVTAQQNQNAMNIANTAASSNKRPGQVTKYPSLA